MLTGRMFTENETAMALAEITKVDPTFNEVGERHSYGAERMMQ